MDMSLLAAGIAVIAGLGAGIGIGIATGNATQAIARQPEAADKIQSVLIIGAGLSEATAIYGLIVSFIILFLK